MRKKIYSMLVLCLVISVSACTKPSTFQLDTSFSSAISSTGNFTLPSDRIPLSQDDLKLILEGLNMSQWKKETQGSQTQPVLFYLMGSSGAFYTFSIQDQRTLISVDVDGNKKPDHYYSSTSNISSISLLIESLDLSRLVLNDIKQSSSFKQAFIGPFGSVTDFTRFDLSLAQSTELRTMLQFDKWTYIQSLPTMVPAINSKFTLFTSINDAANLLMFQTKDGVAYASLCSLDTRVIASYVIPLSISDAILSRLREIADLIEPVNDLLDNVFTQAYIGPTQYIYETDTFLPAYLFSLSAEQNTNLKAMLDIAKWVKTNNNEGYLDAEFVLFNESGDTFYFAYVNTGYVVTIDYHETPERIERYEVITDDFASINNAINSYFAPMAPNDVIADASYVSASFYEGEVMDMTIPDITVALTESQSNTIRDLINPSGWRQAFDIPPMGLALAYVLVDNNGLEYSFLYLNYDAMISIYDVESETVTWWIGPIIGINDAREFLLGLAP
jgi:hypothetical protein